MCITVIVQSVNKYQYIHIYAKEPLPPPFFKKIAVGQF